MHVLQAKFLYWFKSYFSTVFHFILFISIFNSQDFESTTLVIDTWDTYMYTRGTH